MIESERPAEDDARVRSRVLLSRSLGLAHSVVVDPVRAAHSEFMALATEITDGYLAAQARNLHPIAPEEDPRWIEAETKLRTALLGVGEQVDIVN